MTHDDDPESPPALPSPTLSESARDDIFVAIRPLVSEVARLYATRPDVPPVFATTCAVGLHVHRLSGGHSPQHGGAVVVVVTRDVDALEGTLNAALHGMATHVEMGPIDIDDAYLLEVQSPYRASRGRWWCPGGSGYTDSLLRAGVYTQEDAQARVAHSDRSSAVPLRTVLMQIAADPTLFFFRDEREGLKPEPVEGSVAALLQFDLRRAFVDHVCRCAGWAPQSSGS